MHDEKAYVLGFHEIDATQIALAGGKGAHLGELSRIEHVRVPAGFCVTTNAFERVVQETPSIIARIDRLAGLAPDDHEAIRARSAEVREEIEGVTIRDDLAAAIRRALAALGEHEAYAVRSSATAEDLPGASFAGQQDSYLNVVGPAAILEHVRRCWASLFTERAVTYRLRNGFDHRRVRMAVVVQRMVFAEAAGILFTADPIRGNRKVASIEATLGLGEALVSGLVNGDVYEVRGGDVVGKTIRRDEAALTDAQAIRLAALGRRIEAHFGRPQDIEWCLLDDEFSIVQSRPITTLFPIPAAADGENHVYVSIGHQQMMTDAMKPLGISVWQMIAAAPMLEAGARLFVDVTRSLASPARRAALLDLVGKSDPWFRDALETVVERGFIPSLPAEAPAAVAPPPPLEPDPTIPAALIERWEAENAASRRAVVEKSGEELFDFLRADSQELKRTLIDPQNMRVVMAGMEATWWLSEHLEAWLGEKNATDALTQSAPHNVTSEMGWALVDVADAIRPYADVVAYLQQAKDDHFLDELPELAGGREARAAIRAFLDQYGMRCAGEIDITRPRWSEHPTMLLPIILGNIRNFEPGESARRFEQGRREAQKKELEVLERLRSSPDGERRAEETKKMIDRVRTFIGYREYPKYGLICRLFIYKEALMREAERLVQAGVLREKDDMFFLTFPELAEVVRTKQVDEALLRRRKDDFAMYRALTPPRVLTSEGEGITGVYRRADVPPGALVGLPVSAGIVEGRARVIRKMEEAELDPGDILVTAFTDPSWTPLFVAIKGLVTEIGGMMTHGAVIAREYGLPAIVGVENATRLLRDGQRIRVNGVDGYVEIVPDDGGGDVAQTTSASARLK